MKLVVGLGNPGKEYEGSRHNIGFRIVNYLSNEYGGDFNLDKKSNSEVSEIKINPVRSREGSQRASASNGVNSQKVLLAKPQTFVNKSGEAVKKLAKSYKLKPGSLIIIHDDLDIPFGRVKTSFGRSSAGHKGVESIIKALKTDKFYRIRIGTFGNHLAKIRKIKDKRKRLNEMNKFVIGPFGPSEKPKLNKLIETAVEKVLQL